MFKGKARSVGPQISEGMPVPQHVAVIMDGNGRWATVRGLPRMAGHHAGMGSMKDVIRAADDVGVKFLTMYAFSTENWKRPRQEIQYLWQLLEEFFRRDIKELVDRNVQIRFIGDTTHLPLASQKTIERAKEMTRPNTGMVVQFALNYGSRLEIIEAIKAIVKRVETGEISSDDIDASLLSSHLSTAGIPDPDLLIRTSGDQRISNFLLWQIAYSELYFCDKLWPEFQREDFLAALDSYGRRERRFGGLK
ncbi:UDP pyrophosphate synthase [Ferroacidibacillus organovorans]|uniref:Isoprenyl transferase n=2 Tax=Ferroacidibacillus organovorans TaxID=1765683 RepID=A0A101XPA0_9BACL|nr:UDP pyrophosphate synthase [Ferroacidibacillus organovorans]